MFSLRDSNFTRGVRRQKSLSKSLSAICEAWHERAKFKEGSEDFTNQMIRDRIICGVNDDALRTKLLAKSDLTLEKCVKLCRGVTASTEQAKQMSIKQEVHAIRSECGYSGRSHPTGKIHDHCPANGKTCARCGNKNHFA